MIEVKYGNNIITDIPCSDKLKWDVENSDMENKNISHCNWDASDETGTLVVYFEGEGELSSADKTKLDAFVADIVGFVPVNKSKMDIINEVFVEIQGNQEQLARFIAAMNKYPLFALSLEDKGYDMARSQLLVALNAADITQADYDLVYSKIPTNQWG